MYRFKASKYKNASAKVPKKEAWITDLAVGSPLSHGSLVAASAAFVAFYQEDRGGGSLGVLPLEFRGRKEKNMPLLHCHAELVSDFQFSPFHDGLLATGSHDCTIKVWHIPEGGLMESITNPELTLAQETKRIETLAFHPTVETLLSASTNTTFKLWDISKEKEIFAFSNHGDQMLDFSWKGDGSLAATVCKDKKLRILDPRANSLAQEVSSHGNAKDSRVIWLGDTDRILTTGFETGHQRQIYLRDCRKLPQPLRSISVDNSMGILMPYFDPDTNMLFLAGKGDASIHFWEVSDCDPYLTEASKQITEAPTKGACLVPKRALNVMQGEVNRLLQLTQSALIPITYQVPRKTYRDFHADLFPDTFGTEPSMNMTEWLLGQNVMPAKISLDPAKRKSCSLQVNKGPLLFRDNNNMQDEGLPALVPVSERKNSGDGGNVLYHEGPQAKEDSLFDEGFNAELKQPNRKLSADLDNNQINILSSDSCSDDEKKSKSTKPILMPKPTMSPKFSRAKTKDMQLPSTTPPLQNKDEPIPVPKPRKGSGGSSMPIPIPAARRGSSSGPVPAPRPAAGSDQDEVDGAVFSTEKVTPPESNFYGLKDDSSVSPKTFSSQQFTSSSQLGSSPKFTSSPQLSSSPKLSSSPQLSPKMSSSTSPKNSWVREAVAAANSQPPLQPRVVPKKEGGSPKPFAGFRISKFRHLKGTPLHKCHHIENLRNLSTSLPGECDGMHTNVDRVALPLKGPGGRIAVLELCKPGRLPDGVIPVLQNGANIMDFCWDPFDSCKLAVACDDAVVRLWRVPAKGLEKSQEVPEAVLKGHAEKLYLVKFHPLVRDLLATASYDLTVRVWDVSTQEEKFCLQGHTDQIFSLAWSPDGKYFATVCKDNKVRVYNPRMSPQPIKEGPGPLGSRGARVVWVLQGRFLAVSGFDRVSERQVFIYNTEDLSKPLATIGIDVSPSILIPHYDEDSSTLFLTGKGDSTIFAYEVLDEAPFLFALSHHKCPNVHQGLSFLPKTICNVKNVEFARALHLVSSTLEPLSFTVPRVKMDMFQDDLFPDTKILWEPTMSCDEWLAGMNRQAKRMSLQPEGMPLLSSCTPKSTPTSREYRSRDRPEIKSDKQKEQDLAKAVSGILIVDRTLEQDKMEGVDPSEWDD